MSKRIIIGVVIAVLVIIGIVYLVTRKDKATPVPVLSVSANNQTKNADATGHPAAPGDVIVYTLNAENQGDKVIPGYIMEVNISDLTDKSSLKDASGASYNSATNSLIWTPLDIPAHDSISKQFSIQINPQVTSGSMLKVTFNNEINVAIASPTVSGGNVTPAPNPAPYKAPKTGPTGFLPVLLALVATFGIMVFRKYRLKIA